MIRKKKKKKLAKVDEESGYTKDQCHVLVNSENDPFACVLNKTDMSIGALGVNSFYKMQILKMKNNTYNVYSRWGRVGEEGLFVNKEFSNEIKAVSFFVKQFLDKTKLTWADYLSGNYEKVKKKMYPVDIELEDDDEEEDESSVDHNLNPVFLGPRLKNFLRLIFDKNTILSHMKEMNIDIQKLPLGKLSKKQIAEGYKVLETLEKELKKKKTAKNNILTDKSNHFYTVIPHDFGDGKRPSAINTIKMVQEKYDLLNVLGDIEVAASILKKEKNQKNPLQHNYRQLETDLEALDKSSDEFKQIETYTNNTTQTASHCHGWCMGSNVKRSIIDVFRVNRHSEADRYKKHDKLGNRKLLWHGTTAAVVAAIFKGGLRIMPHSGGRVGRGIYLASENNKSAAYVRPSVDSFNNDTNTGLMFICEAALGKMHCIKKDNSRLVAAPPGFDSVLAQGQSEPDSANDLTLKIDGRDVVIPQGKPIKFEVKSKFTQSEYLLYKESQVRIRYILKMKWG